MANIITNAGTAMTRAASRMLFKVKKSSPELLIGGGAALIIVGTVLACRATKKAETIIDDAQKDIEAIHGRAEELKITANQEVDNIRRVKFTMVRELVGAYAIPAAVITTGLAMIFTSHGIMKKRNGAMLAAYNALEAAFQKYRERVRADEDGVSRDRRYMFGDDDYPRENDDAPTNKEAYDINKEGLRMAQSTGLGPYAFEFSKFTSKKWSCHSLSNLNTIRAVEDWANRQLRIYGHLFLNEVLKQLDIDEVPWGQLVGWIRGSENGDNYVELMAIEDQRNMELDDDGWKKPIFLEMNCDGPIWDRI